MAETTINLSEQEIALTLRCIHAARKGGLINQLGGDAEEFERMLGSLENIEAKLSRARSANGG